MLALSRKVDETIKIADGLITVVVLSIRGDKVRLGIAAPRDIDVHRGEIFEAIRRENNGSAHPAGVAGDSQRLSTVDADRPTTGQDGEP